MAWIRSFLIILCSVDIEQAELTNITSLYPSDNSPLIQIETENEVTPIAISREQIHPQIGALNESNPLDNFDLTTHLEQITQIEEQLKDKYIHLAIKWIKGEQRIDRERLTELHSYCLLLDAKVTNPNTSFEKQRSKWLPLYRVEKVLTQ